VGAISVMRSHWATTWRRKLMAVGRRQGTGRRCRLYRSPASRGGTGYWPPRSVPRVTVEGLGDPELIGDRHVDTADSPPLWNCGRSGLLPQVRRYDHLRARSARSYECWPGGAPGNAEPRQAGPRPPPRPIPSLCDPAGGRVQLRLPRNEFTSSEASLRCHGSTCDLFRSGKEGSCRGVCAATAGPRNHLTGIKFCGALGKEAANHCPEPPPPEASRPTTAWPWRCGTAHQGQ
jgi:hypothetical protein